MSAISTANILRKTLPSLFSQRLTALLSDKTTHRLTTGGLVHTDVLVMSRALCSFRRIKLPNESRNAVKAALLQAQRDASSEANVSQIEQDHKNRKTAGLWTWPGLDGSISALAAPSMQCMPETLAREPMSSGQRLVQCLEGVEGQVWENGSLVASRWWPDAPTQRQWVIFLRSARLKTDAVSSELPAVLDVPWRTDLPFLRGAVDAVQTLATPARLLVAMVAVFGSLLLYNGVQFFRYEQVQKSLQAQIATRKEIVSDVLAERNQAILNLSASEQMEKFGSSTALLSGLVGVVENVQGEGMVITKISLSEQLLEVRFSGVPEVSGAALVKQLEGVAALEQVSVDFKSGNKVEVRARLSGDASQ